MQQQEIAEDARQLPRKVGVVSGYFTCMHRGHVDYLRLAREYVGEDGYLIAIVNSDRQAVLKKGYSFVPQEDRLSLVGSSKYVDQAVLSIDADRTVCATMRYLCENNNNTGFGGGEKPTHFLNGGDRTTTGNVPETDVCKEHGVEMVFGLGDKVQSTTHILEKSVLEAYPFVVEAKKLASSASSE